VTLEIPNELTDSKKYMSIDEILDYLRAYKPQYSAIAERHTMKIKHMRETYRDIIMDKIEHDVSENNTN
jgi:hypothetical protein